MLLCSVLFMLSVIKSLYPECHCAECRGAVFEAKRLIFFEYFKIVYC
jgi:hypothetical protein